MMNQHKVPNFEKYTQWVTNLSLSVAYQICEIPWNSPKIQPIAVQGHPKSSMLVSIESSYATSY